MLTLTSILAMLVANPHAAAADNHAHEHDKEAMIASAASAAPASVTDAATIVDHDGNVLRAGTNGFTCIPESTAMGPMCNDATWNAMLAAFMADEPFKPDGFGVTYMLAGEGDAPGVSNIDPRATEPTEDNDWVKEGPHMMLILPMPRCLRAFRPIPKTRFMSCGRARPMRT